MLRLRGWLMFSWCRNTAGAGWRNGSMEVIIAHPKLQGFRRWVLSTKDAHKLYEQFGFIELLRPERWMERPDPNMKESPDYWQR